MVHAAPRPVQIPVYLADSLFLPREVSQQSLHEDGPSYEIRFGGNRHVAIPKALVQAPELFDSAIAACARVAADHAKSKVESAATLSAYLKATAPGYKKLGADAAIEDALWSFTQELADLIEREQDTIWAFIVRNAYRPAMMRERFDVILGNPPWLSFRYIKDLEYQREVKQLAQAKYKVASTKQKLLTQTELATVFMAHALATFGRPGCRLAFVMPYSVLRRPARGTPQAHLPRAISKSAAIGTSSVSGRSFASPVASCSPRKSAVPRAGANLYVACRRIRRQSPRE